MAPTTPRLPQLPSSKPRPSDRVGSYRLEARVGSGGMGEVWRATHCLLGRPAAIKFVRPDALGRTSRQQQGMIRCFELEARVTASLRSPHTIEIYDFGVTEDRGFYYAMELLEGLDLQTLVDRFGPVSAERAGHLLRQVCHSLAEAHGNGLIHRDVKPANVHACRFGRDVDFVKVLDFGLVTTNAASETAQGPVGTPAFMAPEQVLGSRTVDARADIYGVGCLAYWLLTGKQVFAGATPAEVMRHHLETTPTPPSMNTDREIPAALDAAVLACLQKDPERRPATIDAFCAMLSGIRDEDRTERPWTIERASRWWDLHLPLPRPAFLPSPAGLIAATVAA